MRGRRGREYELKWMEISFEDEKHVRLTVA